MSYNDLRDIKVTGPPRANYASSSTARNDPRYRQNTGGLTAFQRERLMAARYGNDAIKLERRSEWDVLKENHRFIRDDEEPEDVSWEERLARAYESKLFKEYAMIDLKHYKSRRLALRWRTAPEVVDGLGEETCGSLRCKWHQLPVPESRDGRVEFDEDDESEDFDQSREAGSSRKRRRKREKEMPRLRAFELPFVYEEAGERKEALVKVKLCSKCQAKLSWKPGKGDVEDEDDNEKPETSSSRRQGREHKEGERSKKHDNRKRHSAEMDDLEESNLGNSRQVFDNHNFNNSQAREYEDRSTRKPYRLDDHRDRHRERSRSPKRNGSENSRSARR